MTKIVLIRIKMLTTSGTYHYLSPPEPIELGDYQVTNDCPLSCTIYVRDFDGTMWKLGDVAAHGRSMLRGLVPGQVIFSNISPEMYTLSPSVKNIVLHTLVGGAGYSGQTIAGFDGPSSLTVSNHFMFPLMVEFSSCPTPLACRRYCGDESELQVKRYFIDAYKPTSTSPPSKVIQAMDGSLRPDTVISVYGLVRPQEGSQKKLFTFRIDDPRIEPPFTFGDTRMVREIFVGVPA